MLDVTIEKTDADETLSSVHTYADIVIRYCIPGYLFLVQEVLDGWRNRWIDEYMDI